MRNPFFRDSDKVHKTGCTTRNRKKKDYTIYAEKTKAIFSCTVTALISNRAVDILFAFRMHARNRFSHDATHFILYSSKSYKVGSIYKLSLLPVVCRNS